MEPSAIITQFYKAFQQNDYKTMQGLYHPDAVFNDPAFVNLTSKEVKAMWQMLITNAKDLRIEFGDVEATGNSGKCTWQASYTFSRTGRPVHNIIHASFEFKDGKIFRHTDVFNFWRWSSQALGVVGMLFGWSTFIQNKVRATARKSLDTF
jgi:ketosteroid isomerase-like protein